MFSATISVVTNHRTLSETRNREALQMKINFRKLCILFALFITTSITQGQTEQNTLAGAWSGALMIGQDSLDMSFTITVQDGNYSAAFISRQMGIYGMPAESMVVNNNRITIRLELLAAEYTGRIRMDESGNVVAFIDGEWFQEGEMVPVILRRPEE